jgi:hypothetical protein
MRLLFLLRQFTFPLSSNHKEESANKHQRNNRQEKGVQRYPRFRKDFPLYQRFYTAPYDNHCCCGIAKRKIHVFCLYQSVEKVDASYQAGDKKHFAKNPLVPNISGS